MTFSTVKISSCLGPKLNEFPPNSLFLYLFLLRKIPNSKYPITGSRTCCHGRVAKGFLISKVLFSSQQFTASGINLFSDQSPPPITFPALAMQYLYFP